MIDADLVLIHGFWSKPSTWDRIVKRLDIDGDLRGLRIHAFGYESPKLRFPGSPARIPDYDDIAQSLPSFLHAKTRDAAPLIFVTHSQGGLILQRYLRWMLSEGQGRALARVRLVVMLACPNEGSEYLASIRAVAGFNRHPQAGQLTTLERDVGDARRIVLRQIINAATTDERQCRIPFRVYSGRTDSIVSRQSAQAVFPDAEVLPGDHFSILDPDSAGNLTVETIKRQILDFLSADEPAPHHSETVRSVSWPRVRDREAVEMGVHPAAFLPPSTSPLALWMHGRREPQVPPAYVTRDHDDALLGSLRAGVQRESGVVLVVGRSCTGKSRSAWEAVSRELGDWFLVDLRDRRQVERLRDGDEPAGDYVLWLDNLDLTDDAPALAKIALAAVDVRGATGRRLAVATMWNQPDTESFRELRELAKKAGAAVHVGEDWTGAELGEATRLAATDRVLGAALQQTGFSPSQVLAGAKWALGLWRNSNPRQTSAVLTAAIDLGRLGIGVPGGAPLTRNLLESCSACYLTRPPGTDDWFEPALRKATTPLEDAVWALTPPPPGAAGYRLFDPLLDYARFERHYDPLPAGVWTALTEADLGREEFGRLAEEARDRLLFQQASTFAERAERAESRPPLPPPQPPRVAPQPPSPPAPSPLTGVPLKASLTSPSRARADALLQADDLEGLLDHAINSNDSYIRRRLAILYERRGDQRGLRELATFSRRGARHWAELLAREGDIEALLRAVVCGDGFAGRALRDWPVAGLDDADRDAILRFGLTPDGRPVRSLR